MLATIEAARAGENLEAGPFPTDNLTLDAALARLAALASPQ